MSSQPWRRGTRVTVFQPYGLPAHSASPTTQEDFDRIVGWLECVFGPAAVERIWYKRRVHCIVVELKTRKKEEVYHRLGNHAWTEILDHTRRDEMNGATQIFMFDEDISHLLSDHEFSDIVPSPNPRLSNFNVKTLGRYPNPSWCHIPNYNGAEKLALPLPPEEVLSRYQSLNIPEETRPAAQPMPTWGASKGSTTSAWGESSMQVESESGARGKSWSTPTPQTQGTLGPKIERKPTKNPIPVTVKEEVIEPTLPPPSPPRKIKAEPVEGDIKIEPGLGGSAPNLDALQLNYLVLFNPIGFNRQNPMDLSQVKCWLESEQLFGHNSVKGFWTRCLDLRIIVTVESTLRQIIPYLGLYCWKDCLVRQHPSIRGETSCIFMLVSDLRGEEAIKKNGFERSPNRRLTQPYNLFKGDKGSDLVLDDAPPDHQMDGQPITESLKQSWELYCHHPIKQEKKRFRCLM